MEVMFVLPPDRNRPVGGSIDPRFMSFEVLLFRFHRSAEKAAEVSRQCDDDHGYSPDGKQYPGKDLLWFRRILLWMNHTTRIRTQ